MANEVKQAGCGLLEDPLRSVGGLPQGGSAKRTNNTNEIKLTHPEMVQFWEMGKFYPSSENENLSVCVMEALVVCLSCHEGCILTMNIYIDGSLCSGFSLDHCLFVSGDNITQLYRDDAISRGRERREGRSGADYDNSPIEAPCMRRGSKKAETSISDKGIYSQAGAL